ncbi:sugar ABC transporter ATP-binding protein [Neoasaia chiangmaiensis NBRC 101099]|uniref:D-xylose ABC transporter ATP-binding protein n=1 Tax=Neoasaia chiangmaiensis TaxID=320497 RepID=A0A1U9KS62_9PROT|nr:xylose ABC transporter ATP-binding protein [Neoasaia chiangmaiensis]AQS88602.1 D-xylose ABC transporter ATP-binding protein [Neoasaia chiangmaiensis]GBR36149.1 sugar ABC transporter ATP-binding protein [Neoasaia chiangmaiensis NBRC 101099]GEN15456.1 xylose import ATP-binding protein XylG [Neoasaia chiangmaiensis]
MSDYLLEMQGITKSFSGVKALDGIDLRVRSGECVGLCGENGAGKSTMMKVLSAVYPYGTWGGTILWEGQELRAGSIRETEAAGIVIIHQELMLVPQLTVAENIFLGREPRTKSGLIDFDRMNIDAQKLLSDLRMGHINVMLPVSHYAGGEQQLIEIAKALSKNAKLLILDEPTSSLTKSETAILLRLVKDLKSRGTACVYISHKLEEIKEIADSVTVIRDGRFVGEAPIAQLAIPDIIRMMVGRDMSNLFPREPHPIGDVVLQAIGITCLDIDNPTRKRVNNVSFSLRQGEILGIAGLVGAGRTELVSAIFGAYPGQHSGELRLEGKTLRIRSPREAVRHGICMVPEDRKLHGIVPGLGVGHNITLSVLDDFTQSGLIDENREFSTIGTAIDRLRIKTASPLLAIANLSGGNQQKAVISKMLEPKPRVLILDEPTRGVDVGAKYEIYKLMFALVKEGMSIIMVFSELPEVLGISDRVLVIGEGELRGDFINDETLTQERILTAAITPLRQAA